MIALIMGVASVLGGAMPGLLAAYNSHLARSDAKAAKDAAERAEAIAHQVKITTLETADKVNGKMDKLVEVTRLSAKAEGILEQKNLQAERRELPPQIKRQEE
jgi:hypothetical protein